MTQANDRRIQMIGDYQSFFKVGNRAFIGIGETPQESRKLAIEAADIKSGSSVFSLISRRLSIKTERTKKGD